MIELRRRSSRPAATLMKESASESMEIRQHTPLAVTGSSSVSFSFLLPSCAFLSSQNSPSRPFDLPAATFLLHQPSRSYLSCLVSLAVVPSKRNPSQPSLSFPPSRCLPLLLSPSFLFFCFCFPESPPFLWLPFCSQKPFLSSPSEALCPLNPLSQP